MIGTIHKLADVSDFFHPVSEILLFHDCSEFKGILHITTFFVTTFFVVQCKDIYFKRKKERLSEFFHFPNHQQPYFYITTFNPTTQLAS